MASISALRSKRIFLIPFEQVATSMRRQFALRIHAPLDGIKINAFLAGTVVMPLYERVS